MNCKNLQKLKFILTLTASWDRNTNVNKHVKLCVNYALSLQNASTGCLLVLEWLVGGGGEGWLLILADGWRGVIKYKPGVVTRR